MTTVSNEITNMQNQTAYTQTKTRTPSTEPDSNVFLTLMLQQLQNQDPTEPTDNTEWLSQLAQYSSLEQMTQMNSYMSAMYSDMVTSSEISQTLSLIGKEVTINVPDPADPTKTIQIKGKVSEASFEDGTGKVKVNGEYYSIGNIVAVRDVEASENAPAAPKDTTPKEAEGEDADIIRINNLRRV